MEYRVAGSSRHNGYKRMFPTVGILVGHDCIEFSVAERGLVNTQMWPDVLREHQPLLGVKPLRCIFPLPVTTQMTLVLTLKQISVYIEEPLKRAARNRVFVQAYLLKKPQTLSRSGCLLLLNPTGGLRSYRSQYQSTADA